MSSPDLFVVCKNCNAEVSPYITECPYCGTRLRKRAPRIDRPEETPKAPKRATRRKPRATARQPKVRAKDKAKSKPERLGRLRSGEIPGIRADHDRRPWATIVLVTLSFGIWLSAAFFVKSELALVALGDDPWLYISATLLNVGLAAQLAAVTGLAVFGWLIERRHGPLVVVALFVLCGPGALAIAVAIDPGTLVFGTHGAALGLLCAWLVPVLMARQRDDGDGDDDADLLGVLVIAAVLLLVPIVSQGSAIAGVVGACLGLLAGLMISLVRPR